MDTTYNTYMFWLCLFAFNVQAHNTIHKDKTLHDLPQLLNMLHIRGIAPHIPVVLHKSVAEVSE